MYKVLVVDDEQSIKRSLRAIVESSGLPFRIVGYAVDGREALDMTRQHEPQLIFTDIRMPVMDGLALAAELSGVPGRPCVVIVSGHEQFEYARQAMQFGVTDYLLKPVSAKQVTAVLTRLVEQWERERVKSAEKHEWLVKNSEHIRELAERLWQTETEEALQVTERIHARFVREEYREFPLSGMLEELLSSVVVQLADRYGKQYELPPVRSEASRLEHAFADVARGLLADIAGQIRQSRNWSYRSHIRKALAFMQENYAEPELTINDVAGQLDMTATYFSKCFKEEVGMNYSRYMLQLRMEKAVELLKRPQTKISEIARDVGYREYTHFCKIFKKSFHCTPSEYRDRHC